MKSLFNREFDAMLKFYTAKQRKSKKFEIHSAFKRTIDMEVRDMLIEEFFFNVCRRYCKMLLFIHLTTNKMLKP